MRLYIRTKQERGPQAGFSVCGGCFCGKVSLRPMKIPAERFLCHRVPFPITKNTGTIQNGMVPVFLY